MPGDYEPFTYAKRGDPAARCRVVKKRGQPLGQPLFLKTTTYPNKFLLAHPSGESLRDRVTVICPPRGVGK